MQAIRIVTKDMGLRKDDDLEYTVAGAKRSFWTGRLPVEGTIAAFMCDDCGRILLYGRPRETDA